MGACLFLDAYDGAASFEDDGVAPDPVLLADLFAVADETEAAFFVNMHAGFVFREDAGLEGPKVVMLTAGDKGPEKGLPNLLTAMAGGDVDADFRDAGVDAAVGDGGKGGPADDGVVQEGDEAAVRKMGGVPLFPGG